MDNLDIETARSIAEMFHKGIRHMRLRNTKYVNELTTRELLVSPLLDMSGYPATHRIPEYEVMRDRPDDSCFLNPIIGNPGYAALVVEVKQFQTDFDKPQRKNARYGSPDRQIQRYLRQHIASGPGTIGILTDGLTWRIYRRTNDLSNPDIEFIAEHSFHTLGYGDIDDPAPVTPEIIEKINNLTRWISRASVAARSVLSLIPPTINLADELFETIDEEIQPNQIIQLLLADEKINTQSNLNEDVTLVGVRKDAHDNDWSQYAYSNTIPIKSTKPDLMGNNAVIAAVQFTYDQDLGLARQDVAMCARTFASASKENAAIVFAYTISPIGTVNIRMAVHALNRVNMTTEFDFRLPSPSARTAIDQLLRLIRNPAQGLTLEQILDPFEAAPLRQAFYKEVAQWTGRMQHGKKLPERQAILRHLVRVMFTWILKEEDIIPTQLFERAFVNANLQNPDHYYKDILEFLFHERLNIPYSVRKPHHISPIEAVMNAAPFLNGSIFAIHDDDDQLQISTEQYWSTDEEEPGLFTILARYHWTMDEHRPGESEQTLDPELLSNLFERLITPTEEGTEPPLRQPQGTYYTPADIADEMVKDALAEAVKEHAPSNMSENTLRQLFSDTDAQLPELTDQQQTALTHRIKQLRIFDPAVGSGEFLFSTLKALQTAMHKLEPHKKNNSADEIIKRQLTGQDINPLAVQITRLRLFIAITSQRKRTPDQEPLPNLEACIVCADTLETIADQQWRPDHPNQFDSADPELIKALTDVAKIRSKWFYAYTETDKQILIAEDSKARDRLKLLLNQKGTLASKELTCFADTVLFNASSTPARTDARLLFYQNPWRGFDIVIGNPPYESLSKTKDRSQRQQLIDEKSYKTVQVGDLYTLFCETALALANPEGGVVVMVVPLSIAFGQRQKSLRKLFNKRCKQINLRHYDNNPGRTFTNSPTVRDMRNNQRTTVFVSQLGDVPDKPLIRSTGQQRWPADEREECLEQRGTTLLPRLHDEVDSRIAGQWARVPTPEVAAMIEAIVNQRNTIATYEEEAGATLAFPKTTRYFISAIPKDKVSPRTETLFNVADMDVLRILMATLNGHVAYGWWRVYGDGFHLNTYELTNFTVPDSWVDDPLPAIEIGQRLIDVIPNCITEHPREGVNWQNVNFHLKPELIEELDHMHITALGLPVEPLLTHLRIMRSNSSWNYKTTD